MTARQTALYWRAFSAACSVLGLSTTAEREAYRHQVLEEEAHVKSTKDVDTTGGFDAVMARMLGDAENYLEAAKFATGDDRRLAEVVRDCAVQVLILSGHQLDPTDYLRGILNQSGLGPDYHLADGELLIDISPTSMRKVFQMLDTHRRRLLRRAGITRGLSFQFGARKVAVNGQLVDAFASLLAYEVRVRCRAA